MAEVSNSVVHLTMRYDKTVLAIGTGVIYKREDQHFIVTAWHNVTGLHPDTMKPVSAQAGVPNNLLVNVALSAGQMGTFRMTFVLPLMNDEHALFYIHPLNWPRVDVVAIPFDPEAPHSVEIHASDGEQRTGMMPMSQTMASGHSLSICPVQQYLVPDENVIQEWFENVDVTDELFIPGYPQNVQDYYSQPVWKRATVASSVQNGWNNEPKFMIDSASKKGMSGSPVFYYNPSGRIHIKQATYFFSPGVAILAGIYVGRLGVTAQEDPQIGTVWHRSVIDEIIDGKCFERLPAEIELPLRELVQVATNSLGTISRQGLENINNPEKPSRIYVRNELLKRVCARASPERALEAVLEAASNYNGPFQPDEGPE